MSWIAAKSPNNDRFEYKWNASGLLLVRDAGQTTEYPHFSVRIRNGEPDPYTYHTSESRTGSRFGMNEIIVAAITIAANA